VVVVLLLRSRGKRVVMLGRASRGRRVVADGECADGTLVDNIRVPFTTIHLNSRRVGISLAIVTIKVDLLWVPILFTSIIAITAGPRQHRLRQVEWPALPQGRVVGAGLGRRCCELALLVAALHAEAGEAHGLCHCC
jgi:hypothetical protein